jgi:hypothetical protein
VTVTIHRRGELVWAAAILAVGVWRVATHRSVEISVLAFLWAARFAWSSTRERPPEPEPDRVLGPGPLAPSGVGRFRATGWPPSRDPDDYR